MNYKTHVTGGLVAGALFISKTNPEISSIPIILGATAFGSLIPDIDHRGSYLGRRFRITSLIVNKAFGHRGLFHAPIAMASLFCSLALATKIGLPEFTQLSKVFIYLYVGLLSHLFLDMFNVTGIPLLYPLKGSYVSLGSVKVGSFTETFIRLGLYVLLIWLVIGIIS